MTENDDRPRNGGPSRETVWRVMDYIFRVLVFIIMVMVIPLMYNYVRLNEQVSLNRFQLSHLPSQQYAKDIQEIRRQVANDHDLLLSISVNVEGLKAQMNGHEKNHQ
tara:strand:+ start:1111 stop:1431 length:321 start_codon:yes stop_codon:yes gene_type:complete